jgi:hypothetical protein
MPSHVDDMMGLVTSEAVLDYLVQGLEDKHPRPVGLDDKYKVGGFQVTLTRSWDQPFLSFDFKHDPENHSIIITADRQIAETAAEVLRGVTVFKPKHIACSWFEDVVLGVLPEKGHPDHAMAVAGQALTKHGLGALTWFAQIHAVIGAPANLLASTMHSPSNQYCLTTAEPSSYTTQRGVQHMFMFLISGAVEAAGCRFGGTLEKIEMDSREAMLNPFTAGRREYRPYLASDASPKGRSITGGLHMFAGGWLLHPSLRQHLHSPSSHGAEVVSAGTNHALSIPIAGILQETHLRCGRPLPMLLDSQSTIFVASDDAAVKKSAWLLRRSLVLRDGVKEGDFEPLFVPDKDNPADPATKYKELAVWRRHYHIILNLPGDPPDAVPLSHATMMTAAAIRV